MTQTLHPGGRRCGAVRDQVNAEIRTVLRCNRAICQKSAALETFIPASDVRLLTGGDSLTDDPFVKTCIPHLVWSTCGDRSFMRGQNETSDDMIAINVRCREPFNNGTAETQHIDGKSF